LGKEKLYRRHEGGAPATSRERRKKRRCKNAHNSRTRGKDIRNGRGKRDMRRGKIILLWQKEAEVRKGKECLNEPSLLRIKKVKEESPYWVNMHKSMGGNLPNERSCKTEGFVAQSCPTEKKRGGCLTIDPKTQGRGGGNPILPIRVRLRRNERGSSRRKKFTVVCQPSFEVIT